MLSIVFTVLALASIVGVNAYGTLETSSPSGLCDVTKQYSGYYKLGTQNKNYFYWFFESRNDPANAPLVLWLTGGPGCSSEVALFGENGPCKVQSDLTTKTNPNSWNENANLIYIDQPAGTGFSYGSHDTNETEVGEDMYEFLQSFLKAHPEYIKTKEFFVFGESYAGHYVPAVTHRIYEGNKNVKSGDIYIPLKGLAIGNGLTDPEIQYAKYPAMACNSGSAPKVPGFDDAKCQKMRAAVPGCVSSIKSCNAGSSLSCGWAYLKCNESLVAPVQMSGINLYDLREKCEHPPLCYDFSVVQKYLDQEHVLETLGVKGHSWTSCNKMVTVGFIGDWMKDYQQLLPDMLQAGIKVLIYAGDQDYICNWLGNKAWTIQLPWSGSDEFARAQDELWSVAGKPAGKVRNVKNFTFLQVYQAGHMVPRDQPENALAMMEIFTQGKSFTSSNDVTVNNLTSSVSDDAEDALQLFDGIVSGLVGDYGGNTKECKTEALYAWDDMKKAVDGFKAAFKVKPTKRMSAVKYAFMMLSDVVADVGQIAFNCGMAMEKLETDVKSLVKSLSKPGGWLIVAEGEAVAIFKNRKEITKDCKEIYTTFEAKNYEAAGEAIASVLKILLEPVPMKPTIVTFVGANILPVDDDTEATPHYEDPMPNGCQAGEKALRIQGVTGDMCAPSCSSATCPTDTPSGVTATPTCALSAPGGSKYCALICSPSADESSLRAGDAQCGVNASCKAISGVGVCTYDK